MKLEQSETNEKAEIPNLGVSANNNLAAALSRQRETVGTGVGITFKIKREELRFYIVPNNV